MAKEKIIVALDVDTAEKAEELVRQLKDEVGAFKVGLELFNSSGPGIFELLRSAGARRLFYDAKFHDIPNTVGRASRAAVGFGVWMINVHCLGGSAMMRSAADSARDEAEKMGVGRPLVIGVTVLTSMDQAAVESELRVGKPVAEYVRHLAVLAKNSGLDGVVASPHEIGIIRDACGSEFLIVTPGVRPASADLGDQKRVMTPGDAVRQGADYLVIGRPITQATNPVEAARTIVRSISVAVD